MQPGFLPPVLWIQYAGAHPQPAVVHSESPTELFHFAHFLVQLPNYGSADNWHRTRQRLVGAAAFSLLEPAFLTKGEDDQKIIWIINQIWIARLSVASSAASLIASAKVG